jgi:hypothetical protein
MFYRETNTMIHLLIPAVFLVVSITACNNGEESSTDVTRELSPLEDMDNGFLGPIRDVEKSAGETQNTKSDNYKKLIGYGGIIGRAKACGINTEGEQRRVKKWIDQNTTPGTVDNQVWHVAFANMTTFWGTETDPKDCDSVLLTYNEAIPWPE